MTEAQFRRAQYRRLVKTYGKEVADEVVALDKRCAADPAFKRRLDDEIDHAALRNADPITAKRIKRDMRGRHAH